MFLGCPTLCSTCNSCECDVISGICLCTTGAPAIVFALAQHNNNASCSTNFVTVAVAAVSQQAQQFSAQHHICHLPCIACIALPLLQHNTGSNAAPHVTRLLIQHSPSNCPRQTQQQASTVNNTMQHEIMTCKPGHRPSKARTQAGLGLGNLQVGLQGPLPATPPHSPTDPFHTSPDTPTPLSNCTTFPDTRTWFCPSACLPVPRCRHHHPPATRVHLDGALLLAQRPPACTPLPAPPPSG